MDLIHCLVEYIPCHYQVVIEAKEYIKKIFY